MNAVQAEAQVNVSVIVVAFNEDAHIKACIDAILSSIINCRFELIVVDDGSTDATLSILESYENRIHLIQTLNHGPSHARNLAIQHSQSKWTIFFDADSIVHPNCIEKLVQSMQELSLNNITSFSVGGKQVVAETAGFMEKKHAWFLERLGFVSDYIHSSSKLIEVKHAPTCNVIYQKESIEKIGGFDENLWPCEDLDLDLRLKKKIQHKVYHFPEAVVEHRRPETTCGLMQMFFRYGFGHGLLLKKHGPTQLIHAMPVILLMALIFLAMNVFTLQFFMFLIVGTMALNIMFWLIKSKKLKQSVFFAILLIGCLLSWHFGFIKALFSMRTRFQS